MKAKAALLAMAAMAMASPQTIANPATGQTVQQQLISQEPTIRTRVGKRKGTGGPKVRLKNDSFWMNQRQKRKRWRQSPNSRPIANRSK